MIEGPPSKLRIVEKAKYEAWKALGNITKEEAMQKYIEILEKFSPNWQNPRAKLWLLEKICIYLFKFSSESINNVIFIKKVIKESI